MLHSRNASDRETRFRGAVIYLRANEDWVWTGNGAVAGGGGRLGV